LIAGSRESAGGVSRGIDFDLDPRRSDLDALKPSKWTQEPGRLSDCSASGALQLSLEVISRLDARSVIADSHDIAIKVCVMAGRALEASNFYWDVARQDVPDVAASAAAQHDPT
jgi:hypothetical protein